MNSSSFYLASNPSGYITTSTNNFGGLTNASITAISPILWSSTSTIYCPTCIATNTGNWAGTWQGINSSSVYLASNPSGYIPIGSVSTTINAFKGVVFDILGSGNVTSTKVNGSTTFSLINSGVASGSYTNANITVSSSGIVTSASNGAGGGVSTSSANSWSQLQTFNGGITVNQTTTIAANIKLASATASSVPFIDGGGYVQALSIGSGLTLSGNSLSAAASASGTINNAVANQFAIYQSTSTVYGTSTATFTPGSSPSATSTLQMGTASSSFCGTFYTPSGTPIYVTFLAGGGMLTDSSSSCQ